MAGQRLVISIIKNSPMHANMFLRRAIASMKKLPIAMLFFPHRLLLAGMISFIIFATQADQTNLTDADCISLDHTTTDEGTTRTVNEMVGACSFLSTTNSAIKMPSADSSS